MKLRCLFGLHQWHYFGERYGRRCQLCWRWEYWHDRKWFYDALGSAEKTGMHIDRQHPKPQKEKR